MCVCAHACAFCVYVPQKEERRGERKEERNIVVDMLLSLLATGKKIFQLIFLSKKNMKLYSYKSHGKVSLRSDYKKLIISRVRKLYKRTHAYNSVSIGTRHKLHVLYSVNNVKV